MPSESSPGRSPGGRVKLPAQVLARLAERFTLLGVLGEGGMGVVLRARDDSSQREVALKVVQASRMGERALARFQREGEITASLNHPGILKVHGAGEVDGMPYLTYELVEGSGTLDAAAQGLDVIQKVELIRDVAQALGYAHEQGVVHRDVKPENILIDQHGRPRVADFGLAAAGGLERLTQTGAAVGTPYYMSPEQFAGQRDAIGPTADVWGLGVVLYELLTQTMPFDGDTLNELKAGIQRATPVPPRSHVDSIPRELEAICLKALCGETSERYADGAAMAADLDNWLAGRSVEADRWRRLHGIRRTWPPIVAVALPLFGLAATGIWFLATRTEAPPPDTDPPVVELSAEPARETWAASVRISGAVRDAGPTVELRVGRELRSLRSGEAFDVEVALRPGENEIHVRAKDAAGNRAERLTLRVLRNRAPDWLLALPEAARPPLPLPEGIRFGALPGEYVHIADESVLVWVPPATFTMGSHPAEDADASAHETPAHQVTLTRGFFLGKHEVTRAQYLRFCERTGRKPPPPPAPGLDDAGKHPVTHVTWNDAVAYCSWARLRLPSEAEWELAARGTDRRIYPWGNEPPRGIGRCNRQGDADGYPATSPVGAFPDGASPSGALDMVGNAYEWVQDVYADRFPEGPQTDPSGPRQGRYRLHKGGGWNSPPTSCRAAMRANTDPTYTNVAVGFRVCRSD